MLEVAGGILIAILVLGFLTALLGAAASRTAAGRSHHQNERGRKNQDVNLVQEPQPTGLQALCQHLDEQQTNEIAERHREEERLARLAVLWADIKPIVEQAVELVNSKLASHRMHLILSKPDFFGRERLAFGALCTLRVEGKSSFGFAYEGQQCLALTDEDGGRLYAGGCHSWSDGVPVQSNQLQINTLADVIADTVNSILEG